MGGWNQAPDFLGMCGACAVGYARAFGAGALHEAIRKKLLGDVVIELFHAVLVQKLLLHQRLENPLHSYHTTRIHLHSLFPRFHQRILNTSATATVAGLRRISTPAGLARPDRYAAWWEIYPVCGTTPPAGGRQLATEAPANVRFACRNEVICCRRQLRRQT